MKFFLEKCVKCSMHRYTDKKATTILDFQSYSLEDEEIMERRMNIIGQNGNIGYDEDEF